MDHFELNNGVLCAENVPLPVIAAEVGTPVYVYSRATLTRHARVFRDALGVLRDVKIAFAVKSNPNLAVLKVLAAEGYGADVVSGGEMERALAAGMAPDGIVFSGVGKTAAEMRRGIEAGIGQFNLESEEEGLELAEIAASMGKVASAALRVNPDVDAGTHDLDQREAEQPQQRQRPAQPGVSVRLQGPSQDGRYQTEQGPEQPVGRCHTLVEQQPHQQQGQREPRGGQPAFHWVPSCSEVRCTGGSPSTRW